MKKFLLLGLCLMVWVCAKATATFTLSNDTLTVTGSCSISDVDTELNKDTVIKHNDYYSETKKKYASITRLDLGGLIITDDPVIPISDLLNKTSSLKVLIAPNGMSIDNIITLCNTVGYSFGGAYSYPSAAGNTMNVYVYNILNMDLVKNLKVSDNLKDVVFSTGSATSATTTATLVDSINHSSLGDIDNLVLSSANLSNQNSVYSGFDALTKTVKRIILSTNANLKSSTFSATTSVVQAISQTTNNNITTTNENIVVLKAGGLNGLTHYTVPASASAVSVNITGTINNDDISFMSGVVNDKLNLSGAVFTGDDAALNGINNATIHYLTLPNYHNVINSTGVDAYKNCGCTNLYGIACFGATKVNGETTDSLHVFTTYTANHLTADTTNVEILANMCKYANSGWTVTPDSVCMSGYLKLNDIHTNVGLFGTSITGGNFKYAYFPTQTDMNFSGTKGAGLKFKNLDLPVDHRMYTLPNGTLTNQGSDFTKLCIPGNFKIIADSAFVNNNQLIQITSTKVDANGDGLGAPIDKGLYTLVLPVSLTYIGEGAFSNDECFTDVYVTNTDSVPECHVNAFSSGTLYGWGGYNNTNPITRASYGAQTKGGKTFGILHWPSGSNEADTKRYTDIQKVYSIADGYQSTDGDGKLLYWPNQTEYNRVYAQATNGYLWKAWGGFYNEPVLTQSAANDYVTSDKAFTDDQHKASVYYHDATEGVTTTLYANSDPTTYNKDYRGWHQFVLTATVNYESDAPHWNFTKFKTNDWYSLCLPFDLDEDQVLDIFGARSGSKLNNIELTKDTMPNVCTLKSVERNYVTSKIILHMTPNICTSTQDYVMNAATDSCITADFKINATSGKKIIIKAGFPYLIKPCLPDTTIDNITTYAKQRIFAYATTTGSQEDARDYDAVKKSKLPYKDWKVQAFDVKQVEGKQDTTKTVIDGTSNAYYYQFVGTYEDVDSLPQYSFFIGHSNAQNRNLFYRNVWSSKTAWNVNTAIIGPQPTLGFNQKSGQSDFTSWKISFTSKDDKFANGVQAKVSMIFDDEDDSSTTGISEVNTDSEINTVLNNTKRVYSINGQEINSNGSLEGLPKGLYIVDGKKYVVR